MTSQRDVEPCEERADAAMGEMMAVDVPAPFVKQPKAGGLPLVSEKRRILSLTEEAIEVNMLVDEVSGGRSDSKAPDTILYLAYGSNLCAKTFRGRRGIKPLAEINVLVPDLKLTFDLPGMPYTEPCFANVAWKNGSHQGRVGPTEDVESTPLLPSDEEPEYRKDRWTKGLVGVVYEVTKADFATIIVTEGGGMSYQDVLVTCHLLPDAPTVPEIPQTPPFKAHTLCAPPESTRTSDAPSSNRTHLHRSHPGYAQPSARYLKLITDGADEHSLPSEYKAYLHTLQPYTVTEVRQRVGQFIFATFWFPVVMAVFAAQKLVADKKGRIPRWYGAFRGGIFKAAWVSYDVFFKRLFGDGERTVGTEYSESVPGDTSRRLGTVFGEAQEKVS